MTRQKNYTRIDALVVILIIVLLFAVSLPALNLPRQEARKFACANILKTFSKANIQYTNDWNGYHLPVGVTGINPATGQPRTVFWPQNEDFRRFLNIDSYRMGVQTSRFYLPDQFVCPSDRNAKARLPEYFYDGVLLSFGYNLTDWVGHEINGGGIWGSVGAVVGYKTDDVNNPAEKLMFADSIGDWWLEWKGAHYENAWDRFGFAPNPVYKSQGGYYRHGCTAYRHSEGANILFYDGHVEYMKKWDIFIIDDWNANPKRPGIWSVILRNNPAPAPPDEWDD